MDSHGGTRSDRHQLLFWLVVGVAAGVIFILRTAYLTLGDAAAGMTDTLALRTMEEATGTLSGLMVLPWLVWVTRRVPPRSTPLPRFLAAHAGAFIVYTVAHTLLLVSARMVVVPALGMGTYDPNPLGLRMLSEAPNDAFFYVILFGAVLAFDGWQSRRERERQYLQMQVELARTQMSNLQLQLQPHFLFNALNTISSVMYEDVRAADEMISHLGDLLRRSLALSADAEVPLREELSLLDSYLQLARARFGERATVCLEVQPDTEHALVPPMLLQPLVENAFKHGVSAEGDGHVQLTAARRGGTLLLAVENDVHSRRTRASVDGGGTGLSVTRRRLELLHGSAGAMEAGPVEDGKRFRVAISLPWRAAPPAPQTSEPDHARAHS